MFTKRKKKLNKKRHSLFIDDFIKDYSLTHCHCELYIPEPSFKYDDFGAVKDICMSEDGENFLWSKHCTLHLCELPFFDPNSLLTLQDTGQDVEISLNITLNKHGKGDLKYMVRDDIWHECSQKNGLKWRTFLLKFDQDSHNYKDFQKQLNTILQLVESPKASQKTYTLVAVQDEKAKAQSPRNQNRFTLERESSVKGSSTILENSVCNSDSDQSDEKNNQNNDETFMEPPFDPAPYETAFTRTVKVLKNFSQELKRQESLPQSKQVSNLLKEISVTCDSLHINPAELPQTLQSVLLSIKNYSNDLDYTQYDPNSIKEPRSVTGTKVFVSETNPGFLSENLSSETVYIPMGAETKEIMASDNKDNPKLRNVKRIGELLAAAINDKDAVNAKQYAMQLAAYDNVWVKLDVGLTAAEELEKEFNLKVFIEDKESSGGNIMLKVRSSDTIRDLKNRMLIKHMFPIEVQVWIVGQRIPQDTETLGQCRIKTEGHSVYLYLVSAKSVGLSKEEFRQRQNMQVGDHDVFGGSNPIKDQHAHPQSNPTPEKPEKPKQRTPKQDIKVPESNLQNKYELKITPQKLQGQHKGSRTPIQGQAKQPTLDDNNPPGRQQTPQEIRRIINQIKPDIAQKAFAAGIPQGMGRVPVMHPEEIEDSSIGWSCSACTFINKPTRPGCEVCGGPRPADYEIPEDYVISEEELQRIHQEEEQDRKTREVQVGERKPDNITERDLDNLLKLFKTL